MESICNNGGPRGGQIFFGFGMVAWSLLLVADIVGKVSFHWELLNCFGLVVFASNLNKHLSRIQILLSTPSAENTGKFIISGSSDTKQWMSVVDVLIIEGKEIFLLISNTTRRK